MVKPRRKLGVALAAGMVPLAALVLAVPAGAGVEDEPDLVAPGDLGTAANVAMSASGGFEARWRSHLNQR